MALKYFLMSEKIMSSYKGEVFNIYTYIHLNIGLAYSGLEKYKKAESNLLKSLSIIQNNEIEIVIHKELAKLYAKKGQLKKAVSYYDILTNTLKNIQKNRSKQFPNITDNQLELINEEHKNQQLFFEKKLIKYTSSKKIF